jgi:hypothetical protein
MTQSRIETVLDAPVQRVGSAAGLRMRLRALQVQQEDLLKMLTELKQDPRSCPPDRRSQMRKAKIARLTHEDILQWQGTVLSSVLQRIWEGRSLTADELIAQITPDDNLVDEARRFMAMFLAILERKGYSSWPAMLP